MTKHNNKQLRNAYNSYLNSTDYELYHVYDRYSQAKINAMEYCRNLMESLNGWGLRIISHNIMQFTVGFMFEEPETGAVSFAYITRDYDRYMNI